MLSRTGSKRPNQRGGGESASITSEPWVSRKSLLRGGAIHFLFISIRSTNNSRISRMHESLGNTIDYIETRSRNLAETKRFFSALWLVVGRLRPGLLLVRRLSNG